MRLETERLTIRSLVPEDAPALQRIYSNPEVLRFLPATEPWTLERAQQGIERHAGLEREKGYARWGVVRKDSGELIGTSGIQPVACTDDIELAYHYSPASWGQGYATEAAIAVLGYGFKTLKLDVVVAVTFPENLGSARVLDKAGMSYVGIATYHGLDGLRKYIAYRETWKPPSLAVDLNP